MPGLVRRVNAFFSVNDFNDLAERGFGKSGEIYRKLAGDSPMISKACG
jgi:hypothetical protein